MKRQYIAIIRDHSASMGNLREAAKQDYNSNLEAIKINSEQTQIITYLTTVKCGVGRLASVVVETQNQNVRYVGPISHYETDGMGTPLFDSIGKAIEVFETTIDRDDPETSYLVMAVTDGQDNRQLNWTTGRLAKKIAELEKTDRWTFAFRVPHGYGQDLIRKFGISEGNVLEWEQTTKGVEKASVATVQAFSTYYNDRSVGKTRSTSFYTNLKNISPQEVKATARDITYEVNTWQVTDGNSGSSIKGFVEEKSGLPYKAGTAYYELIKPEKIQGNKGLVIKDTYASKYYGGDSVRAILGIPNTSTVRVRPGDHGQYKIFVQSRSVNRILPINTSVIVWRNSK